MSNYTPAPVIMLCGGIGVGKDTAAAMLMSKYRAASIALADPLKRIARAAFGFTPAQLWGASEQRTGMAPHYADLSSWRFVEPLIPAGVSPTSAYAAFANTLAKLDETKDVTARAALQQIGTEFGRTLSPRIWIDQAFKTAEALLGGGYRYDRETGLMADPSCPGYDYVVISDGRFRNEIVAALMIGGVTVRIRRETEARPEHRHQSEQELDALPAHFLTGTIFNTGTVEDLGVALDVMMHETYHDPRGVTLRRQAE